ncbi:MULTISPECIES: MobF family relaxase [Cryobacterium]|uniref:Conjugal transfer protein, Dtr system n=1 Tax=Cryobacterium breve TaxID=1259258 RepID=A0ABY2JAJ4_9MICO|nr:MULTISPECIES: MobF family relaxase [Cryobacterium]TFC94499.1 conjugal transfer protein, Dtr system [Cryobacterium sp. TmT3-12]TFD01975.1 conjugal transfer protein, Dtr system [Cryobacterium breve]
MTMHILSAGDGYVYYTNEVATGDAKRESGRELGDYYTEDGNPQGVWVGGGLAALGVSGVVTEEQMKALYGEGLHPGAERIIADAQAQGKTVGEATKAAKLGRSYYGYSTDGTDLSAKIAAGYTDFTKLNGREPNVADRRAIRAREGDLAFRDAKGRPPADKEELGRFITAATRPTQQAVAGFDLVFSPAKSVSVLWGLGDEDTRKTIEDAQAVAILDTVSYLEREAIATRAGTNGVAQIDVEGGLVATRFRHYDSRNGDPQLHDHLVVANKVEGVDGKWRTIDSKLLHRQGVAASEFYNQRVMDEVTTRLGLATELREVTPGKRPVVEIAGIDERLTGVFSTRSADIKKVVGQLEKDYRATHGRSPDAVARIKLAQQATLETRPAKAHARSLAGLRAEWAAKAAERVGAATVTNLLKDARASAPALGSRPGEPRVVDVDRAAREVVATVSEHHAVWGPHMIEAEARRWVQKETSLGPVPAGTVEQITRRALETDSIAVTPPAPHGSFEPLTRRDGSSIYEHKGRMLFTSTGLLAAEDTLLAAGRTRTIAPITVAEFDRTAARHTGPLDAGQRALAREFTTSGTLLVVATGPAGAGKTTALALAARATEQAGGRLIGLAPSATAAAVFRDAVEVPAATIHSFVRAYDTHGDATPDSRHPDELKLRAGDIIVVDEAGMAGTLNLAKVTSIAERHGAHVRLIGDDRQLAAVESGGALRLLEREVGSVKLEEIHRFTSPAEAEATRQLRDPATVGDPFRWYVDNNRVTGGSIDRMTDHVFAAWQHDDEAGKNAIMLAQQNVTVTDLNTRAQAYRMGSGLVSGKKSSQLRDGLAAYQGDRIVTRLNDATLRTGRGTDRVKNGDVWTVGNVQADGALTVTHAGHGGRITLPAEYVQNNVELGYASTIHRAQGMTADTAHVLADSSTSRELVYVGLTRGKEANHLYVETEDAQPMSDVLSTIAGHSDGMLSATETIRAEQARVDDLVTLIDQYGDVAERANTVRFTQLVGHTLDEKDARNLTSSESWGAVTAALTRAETQGLDPASVLRESWNERERGTADDVGAVLSHRMERRIETAPADQAPVAATERPAVPAWIADRRVLDSAGTDPAWRDHLSERYEYLAVRLEERGTAIAVEKPAWAQQLGDVPADGTRRQEWVTLAAEVDVFRDRYKVDPAQTQAIPEAYRERSVGAELASRVTALEKAQTQPTGPNAPEAGREKPVTALDAMRAANRATADRQREAQRAAGLTIKARQGMRGDQTTHTDAQLTRDDGRER